LNAVDTIQKIGNSVTSAMISPIPFALALRARRMARARFQPAAGRGCAVVM
jgi:hypothetical protein